MKILVIDDHKILSDALETHLKKIEQVKQVIKAISVDEAWLQLDKNPNIDLILFDLGLPGFSGLDALKTFIKKANHIPLVVFSGTFNQTTVHDALECGAKSFIAKTASLDDLLTHVRKVLDGGLSVPCMIPEFDESKPHQSNSPKTLTELGATPREVEITKMVVETSKCYKTVAKELNNIAESTVKVHLKSIYRMLSVSSRVELILTISRRNIILR
jgi:DNA-binding NarL/FixJ family response regulator